MDIHKPKPWHGWPEFLKEIGTIVIGVLIALGAEQVVEAVHWSHRVQDAQLRLNHELSALDSYALERDLVAGCLDRRLTDLRTNLLKGSGPWTPLPPMETLTVGAVAYVVPHRQWSDAVWKAVNSDGTAGHLPPDLQQQYSVLYARADQIAAHDNAEYVEAGLFNVLNAKTDIPIAQRLQFAAQIEQERRRNALISLLSRQMMSQAAQFGAHDRADALKWMLGASQTYSACSKLGLLPAGSPPPHLGSNPVTTGIMR